ncbi:hypothetical protein GEMRC1_013258 [Eukaryota sp. GEM-RC1]
MLNDTPFHGKPCRIMFAESNPQRRKTSLDFSRKIGFADFENIEAATKAVKQLHESTTFGDEPIYVSFFQPRKIRKSLLQRQFQSRVAELKAASKNRNLWVGNLPESFTSDQLKAAFEPFGPITSAVVQKTAGGVSKQFGFVCFDNESDAKAALKAMNAKQIDPSMPPLKVCMFRTTERDQYKAKLEQYKNFATRQPVMTRKPHYFPPTQRPYRPTIPGLAQPQEVFTKGARNVSGDYVTATPVAAVPVPVPAAVVTIPTVVEEGAEAEHREKLRFIEMLNNLPDDEQKKEELGERLYPVIEARQPEHAAKNFQYFNFFNVEKVIFFTYVVEFNILYNLEN